jgi:DNA-binding HxlR family transcriptional regulator
VPPRVGYEITDLGRSLAPVFAALSEWGAAHVHDVERARRDHDDARRPRDEPTYARRS